LRWEISDVPPLDWLEPRSSLHILRILQEAFTNIIKHTGATEIRVGTAVESERLLVTLADNGPGFDLNEALKRGGKGLANQLRRAEAIGAELRWISSATGTCLTLSLPIERQCTAETNASEL
jgi:signal transduction histidine kinase